MTDGRFHAVALGFYAGLGFVLALALAGCATLTQPPKSWPPQPSCAQDPTQLGCYPPLTDAKAPK